MKILVRLFASAAMVAFLVPTAFAGDLASNPIYDKNCAKCHGKHGDGRTFGGPPLADPALSLDDVKNIIINGKGKMPKFSGRLTDDQINAVAVAIKELTKNQSK